MLFLKEVVSNRDSYNIIKFGRLEVLEIQNGVIGLLKLKSANQLRDKFEGVAFLSNYSTSLMGELAVEKLLGIKNEATKVFQKKRYPEINIFGRQFAIVTSNFNEFPYVHKDEKRPIIFNVRKNENTIWICGIATHDIFLSNIVPSNREKNLYPDEVQFRGFNKLIPFSSLDDVKEIIYTNGI